MISTAGAPRPRVVRDARIDALRGFALAGILLVNIQSWLAGATVAIGFLPLDAAPVDRAAYFLTAAFVSGKFLPLFAMLFGAGFGLLYDKLQERYERPDAIYRRRMAFLLAFGIAHALLIYFGDITQAYAIAGFFLLRHARASASDVARAAMFWWLVAAAWLGFLLMSAGEVADVAEIADEVRANIALGATQGYVEQWALRAQMAAYQIQNNLIGLPTVIALMLTGLLAQRAGWLADRAASAWSKALRIGLVAGLPVALAAAWWLLGNAELDHVVAMPTWVFGLLSASVVLSFAYAALWMRHAPRALIAWLAPAGRMPLSNYLLQSVAMGALLSGWGLGLGDRVSYAQASALALAVFAVQAEISRWWLRRYAQGPLEALWRWWTYRGAVPRATEAA